MSKTGRLVSSVLSNAANFRQAGSHSTGKPVSRDFQPDETGRLVCDAFCSRQCSRLAQSYRIKCQTKSLTCTEQTLERVSDGPWRETLLPLSTRCYEGVYHSHCRLGIEWSANLLKALKTRWISRVVDSAGYPSAFYCTLNTHYRIVSYRIVAETRFYAVFIHSVAFNVLV